ncbi:threonine dehydrogenase-like Zn-dependent dehydrogenase [Novosphingobium sp. SG751A]|uniref:zinc-dependent alcohol dehydrogenase n=1 Tax=Novosphingobium sp. SG751A TaxID=2587000 RepID=UPI0015578CFF|nr:zinc-dependent alcohol dehydrogenase [Novosphingobium sp. SG751A]NOW46373.1 threonine dehydrogenase-like Zn-dependent dehydrogenase [Novosphingobium sp. SG751A]
MRALTWHGKHDVRVDTVDDPGIVNPRDAIVRVTSSAICGSDLHIYDGLIPAMSAGDILGQEFMGEVVEIGAASTLRRGQRVVVPSTIACGGCYHCAKQQYSACDNGNPPENQDLASLHYGLPSAARFGCGRMAGGYSGGQAEFVRVPFSDTGPLVVPDGVADDRLLLLADTLPAGWQAAQNADIEAGDTVAVWGCGPVGLCAVQASRILGAERVIAIDHYTHRLEQARALGAEAVNFSHTYVHEALIDMTGGVGPDACIDAVGMDAHGTFFEMIADPVNSSISPTMKPSHVIYQAIMACRKGGRISMSGCYGGMIDSFPLGALMRKGLMLRSGQADVQRHMPQLLRLVLDEAIDGAFLISHRHDLEQAADAYLQFHYARNEVTKVVLTTGVYRL